MPECEWLGRVATCCCRPFSHFSMLCAAAGVQHTSAVAVVVVAVVVACCALERARIPCPLQGLTTMGRMVSLAAYHATTCGCVCAQVLLRRETCSFAAAAGDGMGAGLLGRDIHRQRVLVGKLQRQ